jgi:hypothetical protein
MNWSPVPDLASPGRPARVALAVTLLVAVIQALRNSNRMMLTLGDTDDALRLVIVRNLLAGRAWFDTHIERLQPPAGLDMHWSRLLDGAMALFYGALGLVLPPETAELAFRFAWPLLWVFPLMLGAALIARRLGGSTAILAAAIFIASVPVQIQFGPGRIDHHNAQIALAMLALAGAVNLETRWGPWLAGIATGLLFAVGLEAIVFAALCGAKIGLRFADDARFAPAVRRYALGLGISASLAFLAQTPPRLWSVTACDMLAINLVAGLVAASLGLVLASFIAGGRLSRLSAVLAAGGAALAVYLLLDPACAAGPFAHMEPRLHGLWLDHVAEVMNWPTFYAAHPVLAAVLLAPAVLALLAFSIAVLREPGLLRNPALVLVLAAFATALLSGLFVVRVLSYAAAFAAVLFAGVFPRLLPERIGRNFVATALAALVVSPTPVGLAAASIAVKQRAELPADRRSCTDNASFTELAALSPGVFLADIDIGPHLLAHTPHSALAAPYHRMGEGIIAAHDLWSAPPETAVGKLKARGVSYVMLCPARRALPITFPEDSLRRALEKNEAPAGLEPVPAGPVFRLWRVH